MEVWAMGRTLTSTWKGPTSQYQEKNWEMMLNPDVDGYTKSPENTLKTKKQRPAENQNNSKTEV